LDEHPAGWSTIIGADFKLPAGFNEVKYAKKDGRTDWSNPLPYGPICYCHGQRSEEGSLIVNDGKHDIIAGSGLEWAYVFDSEQGRMYVLQARQANETRAIGAFGIGPDGCHWYEAAALSLNGQEPNWSEVQKADGTVSTLEEAGSSNNPATDLFQPC
jgi:hypothetical protein